MPPRRTPGTPARSAARRRRTRRASSPSATVPRTGRAPDRVRPPVPRRSPAATAWPGSAAAWSCPRRSARPARSPARTAPSGRARAAPVPDRSPGSPRAPRRRTRCRSPPTPLHDRHSVAAHGDSHRPFLVKVSRTSLPPGGTVPASGPAQLLTGRFDRGDRVAQVAVEEPFADEAQRQVEEAAAQAGRVAVDVQRDPRAARPVRGDVVLPVAALAESVAVQHFQAYLAGPGPVVAVPLPDAAAGRRALGHVGPVGSLPVHLQVPALAVAEQLLPLGAEVGERGDEPFRRELPGSAHPH